LIYLGMLLRHFSAQGKRFQVRLPAKPDAQKYLARQNFFERFNFDPATVPEHLLRRFTTATSLNDIVDIEHRDGIDEEIALKVRDIIARSSATVDLALIEEIVAELVSNFARHSRGPLAALMMQFYPRMKTIRLAIGDCGIGIRASLSSSAAHADLADKPHYTAALKALQAGVSRSHEGGFGLYTVTDNLEELAGDLVLATGDGYVRRSGSTPFRYGKMAFDLGGVQIEVRIPTK
ncbi:MAG: hypothetical protein ACREDR_48600, partial [Blastocatellia bacterium]